MSRPNFSVKETKVGNGTLDEYTFAFKITNLAHLKVVHLDPAGDVVFEVRGTDTTYLDDVTFDPINGGGKVTLMANLAGSHKLLLYLADDAPTQPSRFRDKGDFTLRKIEEALDVLGGQIQRLAYRMNRTFQFSDVIASDATTMLAIGIPSDSTIPVWTDEGIIWIDRTVLIGETGDSAYQIWLNLGNAGTEADFMDSLKGDPGDDGADGNDGADGLDGAAGLSAYEVWVQEGNIGDEQDFLDSLKGDPGDDGADGTNGTNGTNGASFLTGSGAPGGGVGVDGDSYMDTDTGNIFLKTSGTWNQTSSLPLGGGAGSILFYSPAGDGAMQGEEFDLEHFVFPQGETNRVVALVQIPGNWVPGVFIPRVRIVSYHNDTGWSRYQVKATLFRSADGDAISSTGVATQTFNSNNFSAQTVNNEFMATNIGFTDTSKQIGGTAIAANDFVKLEISRITTSLETTLETKLLKTAGVYLT